MRVGGIGSFHNIDYEHKRIIQELQALGITPTYDKNTDKAKLQATKEKLVDKIANKVEKADGKEAEDFKNTLVGYYQEDGERIRLEEERLGAMTVAELNRIYFGL